MKSICVGDNVIDYYVNSGRMYPGGNAVNAAVHLAKLGEESVYFGNFGTDTMAGVVKRALDRFGVDRSRCYTIEGATTKHCNYEVTDGERRFVNVELGGNWRGPMTLTEDDIAYIGLFDAVISSCNAKMENEMRKIAALDVLFIFDFGEKEKYRTDDYLGKVCPGLDLAMFSMEPEAEDRLRAFAGRVLGKGAANVLLTMGKSGQLLVNRDVCIHGESRLTDVVDTMGAGDAFLAAFVSAAFAAGWRKGGSLPAESVIRALDLASDYARRNCLVEGGFGYEVPEQ